MLISFQNNILKGVFMEFRFIDHFLSEAQCRNVTTLSRPTRYRLRRQGLFPEPVAISPGRKAYRASEIDAWTKGKWKATNPCISN